MASVVEKKQVEIEPIFIDENETKEQTEQEEREEQEEEEEEETHECGICFDPVKIRGVIDCCEHYFCYNCITQWSSQQNTCPVCQRRFEFITKTDETQSKKAGRKRKRPTSFIPYKNQRTAEWNPSMEELLQIADTADQYSSGRRGASSYQASLRSANLMRSHAAYMLARSAASRPYPSHSQRYSLRSSRSSHYPRPASTPQPSHIPHTRSPADFFRPYPNPSSNSTRLSSSSPSHSEPSLPFHAFNPVFPPRNSSPWRQQPSPPTLPPHSQPLPPPRRTTRRRETQQPVMIDLTSDEKEDEDDDDVIALPCFGAPRSRAS